MKNAISRLIHKMDVSRYATNHLIGKDHTIAHRRVAGVIIMFFGVTIVKVTTHIPVDIVHWLGDIVGYGIHGIGLIPFASSVEHSHQFNQSAKSINNEPSSENS